MPEQFVSLDTIGQGVAIEKFNDELLKVLANISDPNTKATVSRSITMKFTFKPDEERSFASATVEASSKLAPSKPVATAIYIGMLAGQHVATERDQRQMSFNDQNVTPIKEIVNGK